MARYADRSVGSRTAGVPADDEPIRIGEDGA
jgi:hypothetical protein